MNYEKKITGYKLSRKWFDFAFDNPEKIRPIHGIIFLFAVEHNNRLGWREKFGFPSEMVMSAIGVSNKSTFYRAFDDLVEWGFIRIVERSKNQFSANIISIFIKSADTKNKSALDSAIIRHSSRHLYGTYVGNPPGTVPIIKQGNKETKEPINQVTARTEIPKILENQNGFLETWENFKKHREEIKKPMTEQAEKLTLKKLEENYQLAVQCMNESIMNGWQGIFPEKIKTSKKDDNKPIFENNL